VIALVYFVLSPRGLHINNPVSIDSTSSSSGTGGETVPTGPGEVEHVYSIVLDAGSTGSRIHVFKFERRAGGGGKGGGGSGGELKLLSDTFEQLKPGLSSYADAPDKAAASLKPLMDAAVAAAPPALHAATAVSLKATAGLRLLPGGKADAILEAVRAFLKTYPFRFAGGDANEAVGVMDGAHEGAYAWLTLNYLLGRLNGGPDGTVAAIDLGGGSVQEAFALTDAAADAAPAGYVSQLHAGGRVWRVYVHSYLGYGLMAARAKVIEAGLSSGKADGGGGDGAAQQPRGHPCFHKGAALKYSYAGKQYEVAEVAEAGDFARCAKAALKALEHGRDCGGRSADECSFGGGWRGKPAGMARQYYVSSYLWDRAADAGIIPDAGATEWRTTPGVSGGDGKGGRCEGLLCCLVNNSMPLKFAVSRGLNFPKPHPTRTLGIRQARRRRLRPRAGRARKVAQKSPRGRRALPVPRPVLLPHGAHAGLRPARGVAADAGQAGKV
jgi:apyrase